LHESGLVTLSIRCILGDIRLKIQVDNFQGRVDLIN